MVFFFYLLKLDQNILENLLNSDSWPIKTKGMYIRFEGKKKIYDLEVGFDNKEENIQKLVTQIVKRMSDLTLERN